MKRFDDIFTTDQWRRIEEVAVQQKKGVGEYLWHFVFPEEQFQRPLKLTEELVIERIKELPIGDEFTLESLFTYQEWKNFSNTIVIGREFRKKTKKVNSEPSQYVLFADKKSSSLAIYRRI